MSLRLPQFLRRVLLLHRARKALLSGDTVKALELARDPCLALSPTAQDLRSRALDWLFRDATLRASRGDVAGAKLCIDTLRVEDAARAREWEAERAALVREPADADAPGERGSRALRNLLHEMRARTSASAPATNSTGGRSPQADPPQVSSRGETNIRALRFHLSVDDAGEFLVASAPTLTLGHLRSASADLAFLADVDSEHAQLVACESFHGGPTWALVKQSTRTILVNGRILERAGELCMLRDGDEVELAANLRFRFRAPEVSSGSAVLELGSGSECEGARRILLFMPGEIGRIRIGARARRHVRVADLASDLSLELRLEGLVVRYDEPMRLLNAHPPAAPTSSPDDRSSSVILPCPPPHTIHVSFHAGESRRTPFGISIGPAERSPFKAP